MKYKKQSPLRQSKKKEKIDYHTNIIISFICYMPIINFACIANGTFRFNRFDTGFENFLHKFGEATERQ